MPLENPPNPPSSKALNLELCGGITEHAARFLSELIREKAIETKYLAEAADLSIDLALTSKLLQSDR
ncbi:hypothetical protein HNR46_001302 [Haloferula luteola]|uniref:Uncharacterized protein n=1 Tax=Haloferula luteola TaxID=595692 RepID=A0A840V8L9_9BACT|nr:hypothetical protein [Haloferula luteola]MBB5351068.1 hypothetical protein [Haloferula luteola]